MSASTNADIPQSVYYAQASEVAFGDAVALSLECKWSFLSIDATDAFTLAAPAFKGQVKVIETTLAANTPVATLAVAVCRGASGAPATRTFSGFGTVSGSAPKSLVLESPDGVAWGIVSMVGVTVA